MAGYQASLVYWVVGVFTAFLTSFYMFRLWFMTFFGEYRGKAEACTVTIADEVSATGHGHGGIHECPQAHAGRRW